MVATLGSFFVLPDITSCQEGVFLGGVAKLFHVNVTTEDSPL